jgi:hypothetical protein
LCDATGDDSSSRAPNCFLICFFVEVVSCKLTPPLRHLSQLQWRMKGNKLTKDKVLEYLKSTEGKSALNNLPLSKKTQYFPNHDAVNGIDNSDIDSFVNSNYVIIFK